MKQLFALILLVFCSSFGHGAVSRLGDIEDLEKMVEFGAEIDGKYRKWKEELPKDADHSFQQFYREMQDRDQQERENLYSSAQDQLTSIENEELSNKEVDNISSRVLQQLLETKDVDLGMRAKRASCSCSGVQCSCCQRVYVRWINLNENCCVAVKYLKEEIGLNVTITVGSKLTLTREVSARNPPPICYPIPITRWIKAGACIQFYEMYYSTTSLRGCVNIVIQVPFFDDPTFPLGCFSFYTGRGKRAENFSYDRPTVIETEAESAVISGEPPFSQRLNDEVYNEDVVLN